MSAFQITVPGCDDATVIVVELTSAELVVVERLAELITAASEFDCQPRLFVRPHVEEDE